MTAKGERKRVFSPAEDEHISNLRGAKTAGEIGADIGRSADAVKRRWRVLGLTDTPTVKRRSVNPGPRRIWAPDTSNDPALIAEYLATKPVTILEPGTAAGLSAIEQQLYAAPVGGDWRQRMANAAAQAMKRKGAG